MSTNNNQMYHTCDNKLITDKAQIDQLHTLLPHEIEEKYDIKYEELIEQYDNIPLNITDYQNSSMMEFLKYSVLSEDWKNNPTMREKFLKYWFVSIPQTLAFWKVMKEIKGSDGPAWNDGPFGWITFAGLDGYGYQIDLLGGVKKEAL